MQGHKPVLRALLHHGSCDSNVVDEIGNTALILAANKGHYDCLEFLIRQVGLDIDHSNKQGQTALIRASMKGHVRIIQLLLLSGADVDIVDYQGFNALERAIDLNLSSSLEVLTDYFVSSGRIDDVVAAKDKVHERRESAMKVDVEL